LGLFFLKKKTTFTTTLSRPYTSTVMMRVFLLNFYLFIYSFLYKIQAAS
jgi:hypothetical protein